MFRATPPRDVLTRPGTVDWDMRDVVEAVDMMSIAAAPTTIRSGDGRLVGEEIGIDKRDDVGAVDRGAADVEGVISGVKSYKPTKRQSKTHEESIYSISNHLAQQSTYTWR